MRIYDRFLGYHVMGNFYFGQLPFAKIFCCTIIHGSRGQTEIDPARLDRGRLYIAVVDNVQRYILNEMSKGLNVVTTLTDGEEEILRIFYNLKKNIIENKLKGSNKNNYLICS